LRLSDTQVPGIVDPAFERVREAFDANCAHRDEPVHRD
jgi:hypothetical protein